MNKTTIFAFPGQGSQYLGMGKNVYDNYQVARDVFNEVDEALGFSLTKIIFESTQEEVTLTYNAQPALMCVSMAILRAIEEETGKKISVKTHKRSSNNSVGKHGYYIHPEKPRTQLWNLAKGMFQ